MQSNDGNAQRGGLNFVFESGSPGRDNQKYVRSHAAKVGWSQRSRNRGAKDDHGPSVPAPVKKRRKTKEQALSSQTSPPQIHSTEPESSTHLTAQPLVHAYPGPYEIPNPQTLPRSHYPPAGHWPSHQIVSNVPNHFGNHAAGPSYVIPSYTYGQPPSQVVDHGMRPSINSYHYDPQIGYATSYYASLSHQTPRSPQSSFQAQQPPQPQSHHTWQPQSQMRQPPAPQTYTNKRDPPMAPIARITSPGSSLPGRSLPTPVPSPLAGNQESQSSRPSPFQGPFNDYEHYPANRSRSRKRARHRLEEREDETNGSGQISPRSPPPSRPMSPHFLDVVMNPDYPFCPPVGSDSDPFGVFPVKWEPYFGRLMGHYRANMLVQLEEITTGWSLRDRLNFNQMPLNLAMSEPALFYALLAAAAIMMPPGSITPRIPQLLQSRTVEALNGAFNDPKRATSDAIILTVNLIALFESTGGNAQVAATVHQPALRKMVDLRGGLNSLFKGDDTDARNFVRFLAWTDRVIWCQVGNPLIFGEFKEDASVTGTNWDDIWERMTKRVEEQRGNVEEILDD